MPKEMGGPGGGTNPEQLFAAGYAACFPPGPQARRGAGGRRRRRLAGRRRGGHRGGRHQLRAAGGADGAPPGRRPGHRRPARRPRARALPLLEGDARQPDGGHQRRHHVVLSGAPAPVGPAPRSCPHPAQRVGGPARPRAGARGPGAVRPDPGRSARPGRGAEPPAGGRHRGGDDRRRRRGAPGPGLPPAACVVGPAARGHELPRRRLRPGRPRPVRLVLRPGQPPRRGHGDLRGLPPRPRAPVPRPARRLLPRDRRGRGRGRDLGRRRRPRPRDGRQRRAATSRRRSVCGPATIAAPAARPRGSPGRR